MVDRRTFLKGAGLTTATGIAGLSGCLGEVTDEDTVRLILTPAEDDVAILNQWEPMFDYLEAETGYEIDADVAADITAVHEALNANQAEIADASPTLAVHSVMNEEVADVIGIRVAFGAAQYFSLITTLPDSGIDSLSDLEGDEIALGDPSSTSGSLVPLLMLHEAGLDIGNAPEGTANDLDITFTDDHARAREEMVTRSGINASGSGAFAQVGYIPQDEFEGDEHADFREISSEYPDNLGTALEEEDDATELELVATSDPIPRAPLLARSEWEGDAREDIEAALLDVTDDDLIDPDAEEELWFTGVEPGSAEDYEPIQNLMDEIGLEMGG